MQSPAILSRSPAVSGRVLAVLVALTVALIGAFVVAPRTLAAGGSGGGFADERSLAVAVRAGFVEYWNSGDRGLSPGLERVVEYWFRYHAAKAGIAALLLIVLVALGVLLWKGFLRADGSGKGRRAALGSGGVLSTVFAVLALAMVMANVQGAIAPFASLLPMVTDGASGGVLTGTLDQVKQQLTSRAGGQSRPALDVIISDFARYHVALAGIAAIVAVAFIAMSVLIWTRYARTESSDRRTRRVLGRFGAFSALMSLAVIAVAVANTTTAADPVPALLAFFDGGW